MKMNKLTNEAEYYMPVETEDDTIEQLPCVNAKVRNYIIFAVVLAFFIIV